MKKYSCPSCSAEIIFQSSLSVSCVCPYCTSLIVRHDTDLESFGKMAQLPDDMSPFQMNTTGVYKGLAFRIVGRLKVAWQDGYWNEWFLYFDDAKKAWLAEAQGTLAMIFEEFLSPEEIKQRFSKPPNLKQNITLSSDDYQVYDIKDSVCVGSEGELPFAAPKGRKVTGVDLISKDGGFAGIEYCEGEPPSVFTGHYVEFDALSFSNLRELEGWKLPRAKSQGKKS